MSILVIAEHNNVSIKPATLNTVMAATQISSLSDGQVHLLVMGHGAGQAAEAASNIVGISQVLHADGQALADGLAENLAAQVMALVQGAGSGSGYFPATAAGKNVAPRVAAKLDVGQIIGRDAGRLGRHFRAPDLCGQRHGHGAKPGRGQGAHGAQDGL